VYFTDRGIEELEKRLITRGTDSLEVIQERIKNARKELQNKDKYDHLVLNDDVDKAYGKLKTIVERILK
jgi:guanylate kinase